MRVISDQMMGPKRRVQLRFDNPWYSYDLLLRVVSTGTMLEGLVLNGVTMHYEDATPWFRTDAAVGATWNTPLGAMKLLSKTATVIGTAGTFTNCWKYQFGPDSSPQFWYLAPGVGIVQFGDAPASFSLSARTANTYLPPVPSTTFGVCPKIGIHPNPAPNDDHSTAGLENLLAGTVTNGARMIQVDPSWVMLEPTPNTYDFTELKRTLALAQKYNLEVALTIRTVDTNNLALPSDLVNRSMSDPQVISRFNTLLTRIAPELNSQVKWIHLGNEVNIYHLTQPATLPAFQTFFAAAKAQVKALKPSLSVGLVFGYWAYWISDAPVRPLVNMSDHVAFTYYPIRGDYSMYDPTIAAADIGEMVALAGGKPLVLTEVGYPSKASSGAGAYTQTTFYSTTLTALKGYSGKIAGASFHTLSDPPSNLVTSISSYYGIQNPNFTSFVAGLGVIDNMGARKPAYNVWVNQALNFGANVGCTVP